MVLNMIAYHTLWDLVYLFGWDLGWYKGDERQIWRIFIGGRNYIYFRATDAETYNAALNLVNSQEIFTILRNASSASGKNVDVKQISFLHSEERKTITIIIK